MGTVVAREFRMEALSVHGRVDQKGGKFYDFRPEDRVPPEHPLCAIKSRPDAALRWISSELDGLYSSVCRPCIAPERLLIALYSIRSDRTLSQQLDCKLMCRWCLDLSGLPTIKWTIRNPVSLEPGERVCLSIGSSALRVH